MFSQNIKDVKLQIIKLVSLQLAFYALKYHFIRRRKLHNISSLFVDSSNVSCDALKNVYK